MQRSGGAFKKKKIYFSQVSNVALRDKNLSLKAKGLYAIIQSYITIEDFTLYKSTLRKVCCEGDTAFENTWKELKEKGYLIQERHQNSDGTFYYIYELLDEPNHTPDFGGVDNQGCGKVGVYNNTELNNTDLNKNIRDIPDDRTDVQNKSKEELSLDEKQEHSSEILMEKEALEFLETAPSKDVVKSNFIRIYKQMRQKYSREYLEMLILRYMECKELKGQNRFHNPDNFFSSKEYVKYLDENWDETFAEAKRLNKINKSSFSKPIKREAEPSNLTEWDLQLNEIFGDD